MIRALVEASATERVPGCEYLSRLITLLVSEG